MSGLPISDPTKLGRAMRIFAVATLMCATVPLLIFLGPALISTLKSAFGGANLSNAHTKSFDAGTLTFGILFSVMVSFLLAAPTAALVAAYLVYRRPLSRLGTYILAILVAPIGQFPLVLGQILWAGRHMALPTGSSWILVLEFLLVGLWQTMLAHAILGIVIVPLVWAATFRWHHPTSIDRPPP